MSLKSIGAGDASTGLYSHKINQSLRFEDGDNPYLSKTLSGSGGTIFTFSCWVKLGNIGINRCLLQGYADANNFAQIVLYSGNYIGMYSATSGTARLFAYTQALQRDSSAWYNIVVKFNGTSGSEEFKIYVNGENQTLTTSTSLSAHQSNIGKNNAHYIGNNYNQSLDMDGYMAEVNFIDGTALDADSFGETKAGIWIPKDTSGLTFGANGFRLKFQDSSALGDDTSGVSPANDFTTVNGLASTDVVLDSPTNNWATMNPLDGNGPDMQEGNLKPFGDTASSVFEGFKGTFPMSSGKWYWEVNAADVNNIMQIGITPTITTAVGSSTNLSYHTDAMVYNSGGTKAIGTGGLGTSPSSKTTTSYGNSYTDGDIIGVALDLDSSTTTLTFYKNNSSQGTAFSSLGESYSDEFVPLFTGIESSFGIFNFGQDSSFAGTKTSGSAAASDSNGVGDFYYSPPSGYLACCTANLPNPGIDPAQDEEPADFFNTVLYTGNGTSSSDTQAISGVGFSPDFTWIKNRSSNSGHILNDRVRGAGKNLFSNSDTTENVGGSTGDLFTSFDSDGFTVNYGYGGGTNNSSNGNGLNYVAWNWLAGGSAVTNNEGSFQSSVSANTKAGFSIVTHENGSGTRTVGHGLDKAPELIIEKKIDATGDWLVQFTVQDGTNDYLRLNQLDGKANGSTAVPTDTVFSPNVGGGADCLAYCFHSVDGYSKVGRYTGNGLVDGSYVYTGFRPAFLIIKRASVSTTSDWIMFDNKRDINNEITQFLYPNASYAEATGSGVLDFLSNGFKLKNAGTGNRNASGNTYIYLAFAEQPFKYSNAR